MLAPPFIGRKVSGVHESSVELSFFTWLTKKRERKVNVAKDISTYVDKIFWTESSEIVSN